MSASRPWIGLVAVAVLCNGLAAGVWKQVNLDVATFCFAFVLGKTLLLWGLWGALGRRPLLDRASRPFLRAALISALLNGLAWVAYFVAFRRGPLALVQTVTAASAPVAVLLGAVFLRERLGAAPRVGVALLVAAGVMLGQADDTAAGGSHSGWLLPCVLGACFWGASHVVCKQAYGLPEADVHRMNLASWAGLAVTLLPCGIWLLGSGQPRTGSLGAAAMVVGLYLAADLAYYAAIARGPVSLVSPLTDLYPVVSILYAVVVLKEVPNRFGWMGITLALPGIALVLAARPSPRS